MNKLIIAVALMVTGAVYAADQHTGTTTTPTTTTPGATTPTPTETTPTSPTANKPTTPGQPMATMNKHDAEMACKGKKGKAMKTCMDEKMKGKM